METTFTRKITSFVINYSNWYSGHGPWESGLLRSSDQRSCCVGLYLLACSVPKHAIRDKRFLNNLALISPELREEVEWLVEENNTSMRQRELALNNDSMVTPSKATRELIISAIIAKQGIKVTFINPEQGAPS